MASGGAGQAGGMVSQDEILDAIQPGLNLRRMVRRRIV